MKLILLRQSGKAVTVRLSRPRVVALGALALVLASLPVLSAVHLLTNSLDRSYIADWRERIAAQQTELKSLETVAAAESQAVGRQLAGMQARLMRMEALGARVAEVASLDEGEFTFDQTPATGGPDSSVRPLAGFELKDALADLSISLKRRESELEVLESLLLDREYDSSTEVVGRPVARGWVSSPFGQRVDPFSGGTAWHAGLDFTARPGTEVRAAAAGIVIFAAYRADYGNTVEINHGDGYVTRYAHQKELKVATGDVVKRGQGIGTVGSTGRASGPHLHFEVLKNGRHVDPRRYIAGNL
ncbi:MAG: M23 family metallopeptidase [Pseudomonadales bacterium]|jgi:murein DD-endopeptidase MepM/ murein hydrolase activator NlpD